MQRNATTFRRKQRLLDLMIHSVYSNGTSFSGNSSPTPQTHWTKKARTFARPEQEGVGRKLLHNPLNGRGRQTLFISDNGVGMNRMS